MDDMYICVYVAIGSICVFVGMNGVWCLCVHCMQVVCTCMWRACIYVFIVDRCYMYGVFVQLLMIYMCMYVVNGACLALITPLRVHPNSYPFKEASRL